MPARNGLINIPSELLRSLVAISERGSVTRAAEQLHLTQSAISAQMKRLQTLVGGDLFRKQGAGVGLTELGVWVAHQAQRILTLNDQIVAVSGRGLKGETIRIGIQSSFVQALLQPVVAKLSRVENLNYRFDAGNGPGLKEKLESGYLDMVFMVALTESRRNLVAEWEEQVVWARAPHFVVPNAGPIPYISREKGFIDRHVLNVLDDHHLPYKVVFSCTDLWNIAAAAQAGIGIISTVERALMDFEGSLIEADDPILPRLPKMRAGVFVKEGFDLKRHKAAVDAFVSAVRPRPAVAIAASTARRNSAS
jgi:DNA-binding transcriptional LysR family regulator